MKLAVINFTVRNIKITIKKNIRDSYIITATMKYAFLLFYAIRTLN